MTTHRSIGRFAISFTLGILLFVPRSAMAHCDGMDGPVVKAAQKALDRGDVNLVLIWVQAADEPEIRRAFERTLAVRTLGAEARELADMYFFEALVRIHRAGEGAPYTGLKPAGRDLGPAIPLADQAVSTGEADALIEFISDETRKGLIERFTHVAEAKSFSTADVEAGREYVRAYVTFMHYVERAYEAASQPVTGHVSEIPHAGATRDK